MAFINSQATPVLDEKEVTECKWIRPSDLAFGRLLGDYPLPSPQMYEINRLCGSTDWESLSDLALKREKLGLRRNTPYVVRCTDGYIDIFPGDDAYPVDLDVTGRSENLPEISHLSLDEYLESKPVRNYSRSVCKFRDTQLGQFGGTVQTEMCNIESDYGHPAPFTSINCGSSTFK